MMSGPADADAVLGCDAPWAPDEDAEPSSRAALQDDAQHSSSRANEAAETRVFCHRLSWCGRDSRLLAGVGGDLKNMTQRRFISHLPLASGRLAVPPAAGGRCCCD